MPSTRPRAKCPTCCPAPGDALFGQVWKSNPWTRKYLQDRQEPSERPVGWLSGCCLLMRRAAFDSVEGFDSRYFMYMEDVDLGDRLGQAGWHNVYVPSAEVTHDKGHAAGKRPEAMMRGAPRRRLPVPRRPARGLVAGADAAGPAGGPGRAAAGRAAGASPGLTDCDVRKARRKTDMIRGK